MTTGDTLSSIRSKLKAHQRRLAEMIVSDPTQPNWRIAQLAGYLDFDPDIEPDAEDKKRLDQSYRNALRSDVIHAYMDALRKQAAAAALESPMLQDMRDRIRGIKAAEWDIQSVNAVTYELMVLKAHFDPGEVLDDDGYGLKCGLSQMEPYQRKMIHALKRTEQCGKCGSGVAGFEIKFEPRLAYAKEILKYGGGYAPARVEVTGRDGAPLVPAAEPRGVSAETFKAVRWAIIGPPVE